MGGWIKLHRKMLDWEWYDDHNTTRLFIHLLLKANHAPQKWQGTVIEAGQLATGLSSLSQQTGLSIQNIRTSLNRLKSTGSLTIQSTNRFSIITLTEWAKHQDEEVEQQANQQAVQQTTNKQLTTNKNNKNNKNIRKYIYDFAKFWEKYPRKVGKPKAQEKYKLLAKSEQQEKEILDGLDRYIEKWKRDKTELKYIPHPTTWLNQGRWQDDVVEDTKTLKSDTRSMRYGTHTQDVESVEQALAKQGYTIDV